MTIAIRKLEKVYRVGVERIHALRGLDLTIERNEFVAIMGASGSGKSTLMNILGCLDRPTTGQYRLAGEAADAMSGDQLAATRNRRIGFVFQSFELLSRQTALQNVMLPLLYSSKHAFNARKLALRALDRVGLADRVKHRPSQLSGGQRQRVAVARALVNEPSLLLADEPTGNLDSRTAEEIIGLFKALHSDGQTIVIVTHEEDVAGHAQRIIRLRDGRVLTDYPTDKDPVHREYLNAVAGMAHRAAAGDAAAGAPAGATA